MKLELGDIKMDSEGGIQIGSVATGPGIQAVQAHTQNHQRTNESVGFPYQGRAMVAIAAHGIVLLLSGLGALTMFLNGQPLGLTLAVFFALQIPSAAGVMWVAWNRPQPVQASRSVPDKVASDQKRLLEFFAQHPESKTVSEIQNALAWSDETALEVVHNLLLSQELDEDVDLESGRFIYRKAEKFYLEADHVSASERFHETQEQRAILKEMK